MLWPMRGAVLHGGGQCYRGVDRCISKSVTPSVRRPHGPPIRQRGWSRGQGRWRDGQRPVKGEGPPVLQVGPGCGSACQGMQRCVACNAPQHTTAHFRPDQAPSKLHNCKRPTRSGPYGEGHVSRAVQAVPCNALTTLASVRHAWPARPDLHRQARGASAARSVHVIRRRLLEGCRGIWWVAMRRYRQRRPGYQ
jgi:hypothetical protein